MLKVKQDKKVNEYFVQFLVWESVEATSEAEAKEILEDNSANSWFDNNYY